MKVLGGFWKILSGSSGRFLGEVDKFASELGTAADKCDEAAKSFGEKQQQVLGAVVAGCWVAGCWVSGCWLMGCWVAG